MPPGRFLLVSEYSPGTVAGFVFGGLERTSFFSPKEPDSLVDTGCSTVNSFHIRRSKYKRYEDYKSEIYAVYVLKEFQRMGIGRNLLKHAAKTLLKSELTSMLAWTLKASPYRTFYEKLGGILIDEKKTGDFGIKTQLVAYGWNDTMPLIQADRQTAR
jgi:GNAT superfamily N-acetyltransferase